MIARKSALIIIIQILNAIIGYIGLKFISFYMEPWEYGIIGFAFGFVSLFSLFGNLGIDSAHVKRISEGKNVGNCIATFGITKICLAGLLSFITIFSVIIWKYVIGRGFESSVHEQAIYVMISYFALLTLTQIMTTSFTAKKEIAKAQIPLLFYTIFRVAATLIVALNDFNPLALAYTYLFGEIFQFTVALYLFRNYKIGKPSVSCFKDYYKFAIPMALVVSAALIMTNIDKVLIQLFWSSKEVGEYFAVYNLARYVILFANAVGLILFPTISEHHSKNNIKLIKKLVVKAERYLSMIIFPIIASMILLAEPIISILLSSKYIHAIPLLQILPIFTLIAVLSKPYDSLFNGINMPNITRNKILIMVFLNIILNILLIPRDIKSIGINLAGLGGTGAALATVISYFIGLIYIKIMAWKITKTKGYTRIIMHAIAVTLTTAVMYGLIQFIFISRWYELLVSFLLFLLIYFSILYIIREFTKDDFYFFIDTLNIKKMTNYILTELRWKK